MDIIQIWVISVSLFVLVFLDVIIIHELIHYFVAKKLGYKPTIKLLSKKNPGVHISINVGNKIGAMDLIKINLAPFPATLLVWMIIPLTVDIGMWMVAVIMTLMNCSNDFLVSYLVWKTWFSKRGKPVNFVKYLMRDEEDEGKKDKKEYRRTFGCSRSLDAGNGG